MQIREANFDDIPAMLNIRLEAKENILRTILTESMVYEAMRTRCKAWVAEIGDTIVGFSIANRANKSVWGLFVLSEYHGQGIGRALLEIAANWLWQQRYGLLRRPPKKIWLETKQGSRAEGFYQHMGWQRGESRPHDEVRYWLIRTSI
ncbi:MAG: hypothetical protein BGO43_10250 [Gammaproteobacteria bacterium 39-13]|nr:GNAT family N-acetyltransferase [Gammaproteobacteria bacterium]OJV90345.1 MAG: hypothetical protein BGO43_10250 [Gammaproteobacteria bacterium 39-13]